MEPHHLGLDIGAIAPLHHGAIANTQVAANRLQQQATHAGQASVYLGYRYPGPVSGQDISLHCWRLWPRLLESGRRSNELQPDPYSC